MPVSFRQPRGDWLKSKFALVLIFGLIYVLAAASSFSGYYGKWGFYDGQQRYGVELVLDGKANRPWAYRPLLPWIANAMEQTVPKPIQAAVYDHGVEGDASRIGSPLALGKGLSYFIRYNALYYLTFLSFVLAVFSLRALALTYVDSRSAYIAPLLFALLFPLILSKGGCYYDMPEILFMALAIYAVRKDNIILTSLVCLVATLNKESFLLFIPALYPFIAANVSVRRKVVFAGAAFGASGLAYVATHVAYMGNAGSEVIFQAFDNVRFYLNPLNLLDLELDYGVVMLRPYSVLWIPFFFLIARYGWVTAPLELRRHILIAATINIPLFILFSNRGETRNLSFLFVGWFLLSALAIQRWLTQDGGVALDTRAAVA